MSDAPFYKATAQVYVNDRLIDPEGKFEFAGVPGKAMEPLNEAAELAVMERDEAKAKSVPDTSDPAAVDPRIAEMEDELRGVRHNLESAEYVGQKLAAELELTNAHADELSVQLETARAEIAELKAAADKFDGEKDGKPGGSKRGV